MKNKQKSSDKAHSEPLQQCNVISCNDLTPKERLSKKLGEITQESKNLKLMHEYFGKENIEKLPFKSISIGGLYTNSWDGSHTLDVNFVTGKVHQSCTVADVGDILITESELKIIEEAIHVRLGKL